MRICVSGANNMGKSTFVDDFLVSRPNYVKGELSYRQKVQEKLGKDPAGTEYRSLSVLGNKETQELIRDSIIEDIGRWTREDNVIYDRGLWDNLVFDLYLCGMSIKDCDGDWMKEQLPIFQEGFKFYDVVFYTPLLEGYSTPVIPDGNTDLDREVVFRSECDNIFKALQKEYLDGKRTWLPKEDTPAIIEVFGTREERIAMTHLYITEDGSAFGEDTSLIANHLQEGLEFKEEFEEMHEETMPK